MPTANQRIAGLAALACLLEIFCGAAGWADSSRKAIVNQPSYRSNAANYNENHQEKSVESFWQRTADDPVAAFTLVLTGLTGVMAASSIFLWKSTDRLVRGAEDTAKRQLRAYVTINGGVGRVVKVDDRLVVDASVVFRNSGQTPGYQFTTWIESELRESAHAVPWGASRPLDKRPNKSIIGAGETANLGKSTYIEDSDVEGLTTARKIVYVWGGADFVDAFGQSRFFRFRCTVGGPRTLNGQWPVKPHRDGYEAN